MNPVVHFEMPYENKQRAADFYSKVFGWQMNQLGPEMGNYILAGTTETDQKTQLPKQPGAINGGFFEKSKDNASPSLTIAVDDIREAMKKVTESGGKILGGQKPGEPDMIQGVGWYIQFQDSEGNRVSLLQPTR